VAPVKRQNGLQQPDVVLAAALRRRITVFEALELFPTESDPVPGLQIVDAFVTQEEEADLLATIDGQPWIEDLLRLVQHYGWRYDYKARRIRRDMYLGPLPPWAATLGVRLKAGGWFEHAPDQVIVNDYQPGQGIASHTDCEPCFGPVVATLSLGDTWVMDFDAPEGGRIALPLPRRSLTVLSGPARRAWRHGIAKRKTEPSLRGRPRHRRVSVTFRTVITDR
jgi:alkylated DNA repair dioxygenase AlkB